MNRFLFAVLLALSFAAGACAPCEETTVLVVDPGNAPMPAYTDVVIEQAQVRCNRPFVIRVCRDFETPGCLNP